MKYLLAGAIIVATTLADVARGADRFVVNPAIPDGQIIWQEPAG